MLASVTSPSDIASFVIAEREVKTVSLLANRKLKGNFIFAMFCFESHVFILDEDRFVHFLQFLRVICQCWCMFYAVKVCFQAKYRTVDEYVTLWCNSAISEFLTHTTGRDFLRSQLNEFLFAL